MRQVDLLALEVTDFRRTHAGRKREAYDPAEHWVAVGIGGGQQVAVELVLQNHGIPLLGSLAGFWWLANRLCE